jgi:long-chain acyl-CoA synthetase
MTTIFSELEAGAWANPEKPALMGGESALSFGEFLGRVRGVAGRFQSLPPGPVALSLKSQADTLVAFFAAAAAGRPAFVLDPQAPPEAVARALAQAGPAVHLTALPDPVPPGELPEISAETEFYWGLTSGTTAAPKIFARAHRSWLATFETAEAVFDFKPEERVALPGDLSHSLFLFGAVHALCRGMTAVLCGPFRPARVARELAARRARVLYVVPAMLDSLMTSRETAWRETVQRIFSSGAKLSDEMRAGVEAALPGVDLVEGYGSSETSYVSYVSTRAPAPEGSVGRLFPGVEVDIRDADGQPCAPGDSGTVWVRSDMTFARYVGGPEAHAPGGWVTASDAGLLADGFLYLKGRVGRIINVAGVKVHPEAVEQALLAHPDIAGAAVVGLDDAKRGQRLAAVVVPHNGTADRASLSACCRAALGPRMTPQSFFRADRLPQTRSGKVAVEAIRQALMRDDPAYEALE